jgi:hypothetical protein
MASLGSVGQPHSRLQLLRGRLGGLEVSEKSAKPLTTDDNSLYQQIGTAPIENNRKGELADEARSMVAPLPSMVMVVAIASRAAGPHQEAWGR